ncbi:MAG: 16S rRNA (guanine(966)-N(2))-methyltransferase RsmD [Desulfobacteraceae bacterium]|nr:16S rRNA (guanine(966)-N(2))-methyltransferase RsmD [Desulfobacteraceae bacterium]
MRVISGIRKGRKLAKIEGDRIRPTSDRTKEAVFNILGPRIREARVLDLFAGTGALGIEALSRGARHAVFMDLNCDIVRQNLLLCRFEPQSTVLCHDIINDPLPDILKGQAFDLVFMDPPYTAGVIEKTLEKEGFVELLAPGGLIIAEHSGKESLQISLSGLDIFRQKKYSKTMISFISKG